MEDSTLNVEAWLKISIEEHTKLVRQSKVQFVDDDGFTTPIMQAIQILAGLSFN